ncbi:MAG: hypothetical protein ACTSRI_21580 [Promethearchaeota archaeon]
MFKNPFHGDNVVIFSMRSEQLKGLKIPDEEMELLIEFRRR